MSNLNNLFPTDSITKEQILNLQEESLKNKINNQVILNLLIEKELITLEDIKTKREFISNQKVYKNEFYRISEERELNSYGLKVEQDKMKMFEAGFNAGYNKE